MQTNEWMFVETYLVILVFHDRWEKSRSNPSVTTTFLADMAKSLLTHLITDTRSWRYNHVSWFFESKGQNFTDQTYWLRNSRKKPYFNGMNQQFYVAWHGLIWQINATWVLGGWPAGYPETRTGSRVLGSGPGLRLNPRVRVSTFDPLRVLSRSNGDVEDRIFIGQGMDFRVDLIIQKGLGLVPNPRFRDLGVCFPS